MEKRIFFPFGSEVNSPEVAGACPHPAKLICQFLDTFVIVCAHNGNHLEYVNRFIAISPYRARHLVYKEVARAL